MLILLSAVLSLTSYAGSKERRGCGAVMYTQETLRRELLLYAITDSRWLGKRTLTQCVKEALAGGATCVQYREKHCSFEEMKAQALPLVRLCKEAKVPFIVNDSPELARLVHADGVHVGQGDADIASARALLGSDAIVGVSVHTLEQAQRAQKRGADYLGVGSIFATATKDDALLTGVEGLRAICAKSDSAVVAIGGLDASSIPLLAQSGACGAAVISALFAQDDIEQAALRLRRLLKTTLNIT